MASDLTRTGEKQENKPVTAKSPNHPGKEREEQPSARLNAPGRSDWLLRTTLPVIGHSVKRSVHGEEGWESCVLRAHLPTNKGRRRLAGGAKFIVIHIVAGILTVDPHIVRR